MALLAPGQHLYERIVFARDARQHALILLTQFRSRVVLQESLDIHAEICVLFHFCFFFPG